MGSIGVPTSGYLRMLRLKNNHVNDASCPSRNGWVTANRLSPQVAPVTSM